MELIISLSFSAVSAALLTLCSLRMLQMMQLSSYQAAGYLRWIKRTKFDYIARYFGLSVFSFASMLMYVFAVRNNIARYFGFAFFIALCLLFIVVQYKAKQKTPLKYTKRIIRQLVLLPVIYLGLSFLAVYFTLNGDFAYSPVAAVPVLIPVIVLLSHYLLLPVEKLIASKYKRKAKKALKGGIIKIGITGSYGKTTAKNILKTLLEKKYRVLASPSSHNTPMGLCKLINAGVNGYDILIAEMGARHKGDIRELCDLVSPDYGIITVTGPQHLETFKTIDNVIKTKLELAAGASKSIVLNADDQGLTAAAKSIPDKSFLFSGATGKDASYSGVTVTAEGTAFRLNLGGVQAQIRTKLLGRHIPALFAQCALLASVLGVSMEEIVSAADEVEQVEHRLQLIKTEKGAVIDDAYNSNPEGAKNALEVLKMFEGDRVVITPGFIELGSGEKQSNTELGAAAANAAHYLIAVKNTDIADGAAKAGMPNTSIIRVQNLDEAIKALDALNLGAPIVLFLNDLPDNY